ncbi:MAG: hypothetical protein M3380_20830 [Chloroflexota bacterium]|nr:hypothetical protein [Chloroflexota bacterium]
MQRPRFDLRWLRSLRFQAIRDRAARLRNLHPLQAQMLRVRGVRLRREYLVPVLALLFLVLALALNAFFAGQQPTADLIAPSALPELTGTPATEIAQAASSPTPTRSVTPVVLLATPQTETPTITPGEVVSGTPSGETVGPNDAPVPLGTPVVRG